VRPTTRGRTAPTRFARGLLVKPSARRAWPYPPPTAKAGRRGPSRAMACFRDHRPITNRQKPSKTQPRTIPKWPVAAAFFGTFAGFVTPFPI